MGDSDIVERLEKQIEGSNLALAAVAEVLQKMDSRLTKAEDEEFEMSQDEEDQIEKQEIIKAVASEVFGLIKADSSNPTGAQWGKASDVNAPSTGKTASNADDAEKAVTIDSKTENANRTIQAMQKQLELLKESLEEDGNGFSKFDPDDVGDGEGEDDEDVDDDEDEEKEFPEDVQEMAKQIANLQKMVSKKNGNVQKMIANDTENRLRKMGFQEENGLNRPRLIQYGDMGVDGAAPIRKSSTNPDETVDQMMQMSYSELRRLQEQIESGDTNGVPRELLG